MACTTALSGLRTAERSAPFVGSITTEPVPPKPSLTLPMSPPPRYVEPVPDAMMLARMTPPRTYSCPVLYGHHVVSGDATRVFKLVMHHSTASRSGSRQVVRGARDTVHLCSSQTFALVSGACVRPKAAKPATILRSVSPMPTMMFKI